MKSKEWRGPTLWECWKDVHSFKDFREFLPLLVPLPLYRLGRTIRHPKWWWAGRRQIRWAKGLKVGDKVVDCSYEVVILVEKIDDFCFLDENGRYHDIIACCDPYLGEQNVNNN